MGKSILHKKKYLFGLMLFYIDNIGLPKEIYPYFEWFAHKEMISFIVCFVDYDNTWGILLSSNSYVPIYAGVGK